MHRVKIIVEEHVHRKDGEEVSLYHVIQVKNTTSISTYFNKLTAVQLQDYIRRGADVTIKPKPIN